MEEWQKIFYPFGFLAAIAFGARFIVQWIDSEVQKKVTVPLAFWYLSLLGNILLAIHSFIQVQFHICIVQVCNGIISWRNLNLTSGKSHFSLRGILYLLGASICLTVLAFALQDFVLSRDGHWFRVPTAPWQKEQMSDLSWGWHLLGSFSYLLFSSRFWVQWWLSEKKQESILPASFWWLSLIGAILSIVYFWHMNDTVNLIGPLVGLIPYARNLMLMKKNRVTA